MRFFKYNVILPCSFSMSQSSHHIRLLPLTNTPKCPHNKPVILTMNFELGIFATFASLVIPLNRYNSENSEVH